MEKTGKKLKEQTKKFVVEKRFTDIKTGKIYRPGNYFQSDDVEWIKDLKERGFLGQRIGPVPTDCQGVVTGLGSGIGQIIDANGRDYLLAKVSFSHFTAQERRLLKLRVGDVVQFNYMHGERFPDVYVAVDLQLTPYVREVFGSEKKGHYFGECFHRSKLSTWKGNYRLPSKSGNDDDRRSYQKALVQEAADEN